MKVFLVLALAVVARGTVIRYAPAAGVLETGDSAQFRSEDSLGNYNFGYNEDHTSGGSFRREAGDAHGNVAGSYGLRDADGRLRIVNYVADDAGFRADIKTNEPGVEPKDPADVAINKASAVIVESAPAPVILAPAPIAVAPAPYFPAPLAKSISTTTYTASAPAFIAAPAPIAVKSAHVFPAPVAAPIAKTSTVEIVHAPAPAPVAVVEPAPVVLKSAYSFPPAGPAPVAKTVAAPLLHAEPAPIQFAQPAPIQFAEETPITYSHVAIPEADHQPIALGAPINYASHLAAAPSVAYGSPLAIQGPIQYASPLAYNQVALAGPAHYANSYYAPAPVTLKSAGAHYTSGISPLHYGLPSPAVSIMGASAYLNPYHFNGVSYVKK